MFMFFFQKMFLNVSTNIYIYTYIYIILYLHIHICVCFFFFLNIVSTFCSLFIFSEICSIISFPSLFLCFLLVWSCFCLLNFMHLIGDSQFVCALCWLYFLMLAAFHQCFGSAVAQHDLLVLLVLCVWVCHGVSDRGRGRTGFEGCKRLRV